MPLDPANCKWAYSDPERHGLVPEDHFDPKAKRRAERQQFIDRMNQAKTISEAGHVRRELEAFDKETRDRRLS